MVETLKCSKCKKPVYLADGGGMAACMECPRSYVRCAECGGQDGARRSLKSHIGLVHPKTTERF